VSARPPLATRALPPDLAARARAADLSDETLQLVDEASSWLPALTPEAHRAFGLVVLALEAARAAGGSRLPQGAVAPTLERLGFDDEDARAAAAFAAAPPRAVAPLFGAGDDYKPFVLDDGCLYAQRDRLVEVRLARAVAARLSAPLPVDADAIEDALLAAAPPGRTFNAGQRAALRAALTRPLAVIAGGPGTGKTALLAGLVRALRRLGLEAGDIALAAPTGRAANRIAESLRAAGLADAPEPMTLHRLLGIRRGRAGGGPGEARHHENHPVRARAVLVDEASMIDLDLMERLTRAVAPDARLVLLGDADQLPSVEAGAVFRELGAHAVRLTESLRQDPSAPSGASVLAAARAVREGDAEALAVAARARPADLAFAGFERLAPATPAHERRLVAAFADHWVRARVRALPDHDALVARVYRWGDDPAAPFDADDGAALLALVRHHGSLRVLAVTRGAGAPTGAEALNALLLRHAGAASPAAAREGADPAAPAPGTPVMMIRNDYDRGLFNGDQGVVVRAARPGGAPRLAAVFPRGGGLAAFAYDGLREDLRVAYATTVHKAQGAELDHVALVLPERDLPLLSRELVYTALTRARHSAVVVGRAELLALAVQRPLERASGLAARLDALLSNG
jgi:exodeoxyribonuclease V alpha subunit